MPTSEAEVSENADVLQTDDRGGAGRTPNIKLTRFYGEPSKYQEWKREIEATRAIYKVTKAQLAGLVYLALAPGETKPRDLLSHIDISTICSDDGYDDIFKILDTEFERKDYIKSDEAQARYEKCYRAPRCSMEQYIRDLKLSKRILEKEDHGSTISDVSFARRLLRKSGLTRIEQRGVLAAAGAKWESKPTEDALKLLYGDAHLEDQRRLKEKSNFKGTIHRKNDN